MQAIPKLPEIFPDDDQALPSSPPIRIRTPASRFLILSYRVVDVAIAVASVLGAFIITNLSALPGDAAGFLALRVSIKNLLLLTLFAFVWSSVFRAFGLYQKPRLNLNAVLRVIFATACGSSFTLLLMFTSRAARFQLSTVFLSWILAVTLTIAARVVLGALTGPTTLNKKHARHVLIVGSGSRALRVYRELSGRSGADYRVLGFVDSGGPRSMSSEVQHRMMGDLSQLEDILVGNVVDEVLITLPVKSCYAQIQSAIAVCERVGVESKYLSEIFQPSLARAGYEQIEGFAVTSLKLVQDDSRFIIKRAIDIAGAWLILILLSPLMIVIALLIKLTSPGPVIFSQERYGRNKRRFRMHKFRTMVSDAEALQKDLEHRNEVSGPVFKIKDDPRITPLGRVLRRTSVDELPQLFNVLKGEMSLVGPRPLPLRDVMRFEEGRLMRRFCVAPGLTGLWQVNGRSHASFDQWVAHDLKYIDTWSLTLDIKILLRTVPAVVKGVGAL